VGWGKSAEVGGVERIPDKRQGGEKGDKAGQAGYHHRGCAMAPGNLWRALSHLTSCLDLHYRQRSTTDSTQQRWQLRDAARLLRRDREKAQFSLPSTIAGAESRCLSRR
jgi:hypothetical protein